MARKLKGKVNSKGLKAALLRQQSQEKLRLKQKKKEQAEIKKKSQPPKKIVQNQEAQKADLPTFIPFERNETLLLIGEGDFSFAKSIIEQDYILPGNLIATSFDASPTELRLKYPNTFEENYKFLINEGVKILFKVDGTKLIKSLKLSKKTPWSKIVGPAWKSKYLNNIMFNFPHTGKGIKDQDRNIKDHQELVFGYFDSSKQLFSLINKPLKSATSGYTLGYSTEKNQDSEGISSEGYGKIILSVFDGEPYDSWQIKMLAKKNALHVERSNKFQWENFPGYHHRRTNSEQTTTKPAEERNARIFIFKKFEKAKHSKSKRNRNIDDDDSDEDER
ncbi:25S rRNA (uracil2634-N3)-methyltransferase NDAI_0B03570 [Naumovozyma dairenensis CBS 421]|uniref:25S rRNA (uridine-N(3))-methyltransferase BMT5-like domain-containing protein n=1 Tax=Naumovozyma dairenensis (strain ATCC 10597 / BCRC 20456 / CBS 421 / NBRC 0211 / NRRL Y-12639) TaxID=1071378 RepID=G0W6I0_NAUDC|nr:hypothetical protein NDAI_0B03570 [Naumovozyma dairenensis CBS 421]CCD23391.1 hypothetical protein NDAI_0B03570 [Naumovozyma dairenensis CBS 421]